MIARRVARAVAACDLEPSTLPPSALLFVRRLPDPAPRTLLVNRQLWERHARAKLEEIASRAIHAVTSPDAGDLAPAVWFASRLEMMTCLVTDIAAHRATRLWWWRTAIRELGSRTGGRAAATVLLREPHAIPEMIRLLEASGRLDVVFQSLDDADLDAICRALERTFDVSAHLTETSPSTSDLPSMDTPTAAAVSTPSRAHASAATAIGPEHRHWKSARVLLLARALRHAPRSAHRAELLRQYRALTRAAPSADARAPIASPPAHDAASPILDPPTRTVTVATAWGGILYLVNVMKALQLPDSVHDDVSAWAMLELLGRAMAGGHARYDPLWRALAVADGRDPEQAAAAGARDPDIYRLPDSWPAPATGFVYGKARADRLLLRHPGGFTMYDGPPRRPDGVRIVGGRGQQWRLPRQSTPALHRLLSFLVPYVTWWLRHRLGGELDRRLFNIAGTVVFSPTHVDAEFGMDSVSLPVRLAGLDANPGWMPAFGRAITYHFR